MNDPNLQRVELVAGALGELCDELVLVGGCATGLLCTSMQAPPPRATFDVDLVAQVTALAGYHALEARFAERGFMRDMSQDAPICRWRFGAGIPGDEIRGVCATRRQGHHGQPRFRGHHQRAGRPSGSRGGDCGEQ